MFDNNRKTVAIASAVVAIAIFALNLLLNRGSLLLASVSALLSVPFFLLGTRALHGYRGSLAERASRPAGDAANVVWDVYLNKVHVGTISDDRLAALQDAVADNWRNMATQAINLFGVPLRMFDLFVSTVPAVAFWLILGWAMIGPDSLAQTFSDIRNSSLQELQHGVSVGLWILVNVCVMAFALRICFGGQTYGARNVYLEALSDLLRQELKVAATGSMTISRLSNGEVSLFQDDMKGWYRARGRARRAARAAKA
ncbi:hypothetical protein QZM25_28270 [Burkholderia contaminans]|uniref:hypothetical protein n=1 Tax=Burkholderia cepacia complex TaxID=87882 RepID=UPI001CF17F3E|nr:MULTISPECIES: hypothetical protein [Burkholderia cepacia complex]MCA7889761.1 hypothetical protein [Burkholderia contaminans]MDN7576513.1 hypothetical protein [Burkholderia contaminans]MDN7670663.1 hypothetical protein [Burkholderia vietnamiensis]